jgi:D-alanyl-D-alanine-carboxypeptidase/D-alanyl-D-alanine-endopeptidase
MPRDIPDTDAIFAKDDFRTRPYELIAVSKGYDRSQILAVLHEAQLRDAPGEKEAYSNAGFLVVGFGLEKVYAQSFSQLMSRAILVPLGMTSTGFSLRSSDRYRLVKGYDRYGRIMPYHPLNAGAAWGLYSSTEDLAKFIRWQLNEKDPVANQSHQPLIGSERDGVGMAWQLAYDGDQPMVWHGGGSFGTSAQVVLFPKQREGYALLANDTCKGTEGALRDIAVSLHAKVR